jgi:hypothetical protein
MPLISEAKRTLIAAVSVIASAWLYGLIVAPWLEGGPRPKISLEIDVSPVADQATSQDEELAALFPPGSWELGARKKLQVEQGRAYFREYVPTEAGDLEVKPFTLVLLAESESGEIDPQIPPIILRAPEGALLTFDQPVTLGFHRTGKLKRAVLRGEVTIDRQAAPDVEPIRLVTHNIQLQDDRIFTPHAVDFRFGDHHGVGQNLMIQLLTEPSGNSSAPVPAVKGIRSVELIKLEKLILAVPPSPSVLPAAPGVVPEATQLAISCAGSFQFDLTTMQATLRHNVVLSHLRPGWPQALESLVADRITVRFERRPAQPGSRSTIYSAEQLPAPTELQVREVIAVGAPAVLDSPLRAMHAEAALLGYDPVEQKVRLQDDNHVILVHEDFRFEAPNLEYDIDPQRRLGRARSIGAGRLIRSGSNDREPMAVSWQEEMLLRPHDGLDAISLYGSPNLSMGTESRFDARELHLWIREVPDRTPLTTTVTPSSRRTLLQPDKMLAQGGVRVASPQLSGVAERLEVFWEETLALPTDPFSDQVPSNTTPLNAAPIASSSTNSASSPRGPGGLQLQTDSGNNGARRRMHVEGTYVRARLVPVAKTFEVDEITIEGEASLHEETAEPGVTPLAIQGRMLRVESIGGGLFSAYIVSEPNDGQATLAARGLELFGAELQLDQRTHRMWTDGAGEARLRPPSDSAGASRLDGPAIVRWTGGLEFDGKVVRVRGEVVIVIRSRGEDGTKSIIEIRGDSLDLNLTDRVDFRGLNGGDQQEAIDILSLGMAGPIEMTHWESSPDGRPRSIDRFSIRDVTIDYRTGEIGARGPGLGRSIRLGSSAAMTGQAAAESNELRLVRIEFAEGVEGNLFRKQLAFVRQVEVLSDTVAHWDDWRERDVLLASSAVVLMRGDRLETNSVTVEQNTPASWEVAMIGNAFAQANTFDASANRMVYVQGKDLLVLEGGQREDAQLTWARRGSTGRDSARARKIMYWRTEGRVEVDDVSSVDATFSGRMDGASRNRPTVMPRR